MPQDPAPHSAAYFGDFRDFWWNRDFLELMARRWELHTVSSVLDVGCGLGHWGRCLGSVLPVSASILGVDREEEWIRQCESRVSDNDKKRFRYQIGDVNALAFDDNTFDVVTCQTVLIHVEKPEHALREMIRVVRPGGLVIAVEPNNRAGALIGNSLTIENPIEETLKYARFHLTCERGKRLLGLGDTSLGDLLPGLMQSAGATDILVYLSDKTSAVFPPYEGNEQQTLIAQAKEMKATETWMWDRTESERYFVAGGGNPADFPEIWKFVIENDGSFEAAIEAGTYYTSGGAMMYLVSGRKR